MSSALMDTYARLDVTFTHGEACRLFDEQGAAYFDAIAGIGVNSLGHAHPAVTAAIAEQAGKLLHTSNLYHIERQVELAGRLTKTAAMERCFFGNSGAEANEAAIKLARLRGHRHGIANPTIVVMEQAFHGRTMATLTATDNRKIQAGFEPLVSGFVRAPFNDVEAVRKIAKNNAEVVAILVEPIQGEGGVNVPADNYLAALRDICDARDWLLMLDEVQSGNCRTGTWFACQGYGVQPDVITTAKALANGVPIGVCMARGDAARILGRGNHGSTYGGNPLACAAALAVMEVMHGKQLAQRADDLGGRLLDGFGERLGRLPGVVDIRGRGLMLGIQLDRDCGELVRQALAEKLLINVTAGNTVRLLPPLIMSESDADELVDRLSTLVAAFLGGSLPSAATG